MTPDELKEKEERNRIYASTRQDLLARNLSNAEKYDNAILTLSTGILGASLAFIKDIVPLDRAEYILLIKISWWLFGAAIVSTLVSFVVSQHAIKRQLEYAEKYYLDGDEKYLREKNDPATLTDYINYASGAFFIAGIIASVLFVSVNIKGGLAMSKETKQPLNEGAPVPSLQRLTGVPEKQDSSFQHIQGGAPVPSMQKIETAPGKKGAPVPAMQPVSQPAQTGQQTQGSSGSQAGNTNNK